MITTIPTCWVLFVTTKVEKSNFYMDLNKLIDSEFRRQKNEKFKERCSPLNDL